VLSVCVRQPLPVQCLASPESQEQTAESYPLPDFPVGLMGTTPPAVLPQFNAVRVIPPVLRGRVVPLAAFGAGEMDRRAVFLLGHGINSSADAGDAGTLQARITNSRSY
jgi:hypothetical protein